MPALSNWLVSGQTQALSSHRAYRTCTNDASVSFCVGQVREGERNDHGVRLHGSFHSSDWPRSGAWGSDCATHKEWCDGFFKGLQRVSHRRSGGDEVAVTVAAGHGRPGCDGVVPYVEDSGELFAGLDGDEGVADLSGERMVLRVLDPELAHDLAGERGSVEVNAVCPVAFDGLSQLLDGRRGADRLRPTMRGIPEKSTDSRCTRERS